MWFINFALLSGWLWLILHVKWPVLMPLKQHGPCLLQLGGKHSCSLKGEEQLLPMGVRHIADSTK